MNSRKKLVFTVISGVIFLFIVLWSINKLIYKNTAETEVLDIDARKQNLSNLTYFIDGENKTFKAGMNDFYKLEELTAYGDVDKDGDRDYVFIIKNNENPQKPAFLIGVALYSETGLTTQPTQPIGPDIIPHSLIIGENGTITLQYKKHSQDKNISFKEYTYSNQSLTETNSRSSNE